MTKTVGSPSTRDTSGLCKNRVSILFWPCNLQSEEARLILRQWCTSYIVHQINDASSSSRARRGKVLRYNINDGVVRDSVVKSRIVEYELLEEAEC